MYDHYDGNDTPSIPQSKVQHRPKRIMQLIASIDMTLSCLMEDTVCQMTHWTYAGDTHLLKLFPYKPNESNGTNDAPRKSHDISDYGAMQTEITYYSSMTQQMLQN